MQLVCIKVATNNALVISESAMQVNRIHIK